MEVESVNENDDTCSTDRYDLVNVECESVEFVENDDSANVSLENSDDEEMVQEIYDVDTENNETSCYHVNENKNDEDKILSSNSDSDKISDIDFDEKNNMRDSDKCPDDETVLLSNEGISLAPGENNVPRSTLLDKNAESCTFMKIYAGTLQSIPDHLTHQKVLQSEIARSDRRCCDPYRFFHAAGILRIEKMSQKICICLKRSRTNPLLHLPTTFNRVITASQLLNDAFVSNLTSKDCAYKMFKHDRGSPAYFAQKKRDLFAMIRQLGPPSIFLTLSSAETRWLELLVILKKTVDNEIITESEANELTSHERRRLLRSDPVTAARYFRYKLKCIFKLLKKSKHCIFGKYYVKDFYIRTEFQFRGSPHVHIILWLNDSPIFKENEDSRKKCEEFIDELITCAKIDESEFPNIAYQMHHHSRTCKRKKKGRSYCRFNIPWFPMDELKF